MGIINAAGFITFSILIDKILYYYFISVYLLFSEVYLLLQKLGVVSNIHHQGESRRINRVWQSSPSNRSLSVFEIYSSIYFSVKS